ncbi:GNAT family N-acetyltransferase [Arthrobacter woluwensis]|uniref:Acetyltransferase (GNAT) family protein n=1 Tax=Arthrobacter woluwensis TaxID=156980 RepID=A0A1H4JRF7_9MICC|nr:GNAT family N-acetyltransferase [Arthrobacter woluwensis]SEB48904.1 Acetyltransferase (GNAT) family protein [Arthrobacter woluwensis]
MNSAGKGVVTIREAGPGDRAGLVRVMAKAGLSEGFLVEHGVGDPRLGKAVPRRALGMKAFRKAIGKGAGDPWSGAALMLATTVLVAVDQEGIVVGGGVVAPSIASIHDAVAGRSARREELTLRGLADTPQLVAIAVDPAHRNRGVGKALFDALVWHYRLSGAPLLHGVIQAESEPWIPEFLRRAGFRVAGPDAFLDFTSVYTTRSYLASGPGRRFFYLDFRSPGAHDWEIPAAVRNGGDSAAPRSVRSAPRER